MDNVPEEFPVLLTEQEIRKLEYFVRNRIVHAERRRLTVVPQVAKSLEGTIAMLEALQDKLERARLRV